MGTLCADLHTFLGTSRAYLDKYLLVGKLLRTKLVEKNKTNICCGQHTIPASHTGLEMMKQK